MLSFDSTLGRCANYSRYSPEQKAQIGRYVASTNIASAVTKYQADFPNLRERTVFEFKKAYLKQKESSGKEVTILKAKKRGRPKLLPEEIMIKSNQSNLFFNMILQILIYFNTNKMVKYLQLQIMCGDTTCKETLYGSTRHNAKKNKPTN